MSNNEDNTQTSRPTSPTPSLETTVTTNTIIIPATKPDGTPVKIWMCEESREKRRQTQKAYREKKSKELKEKSKRLEDLEEFAKTIHSHQLTLIYSDGVEQHEYQSDDKLDALLSLLLESLRKNNVIHSFKLD